MKIYFILSVCLISTLRLFAQNPRTLDSLFTRVESGNQKERINTYVAIAREYRQINADSTNWYAQIAIQKAELFKYPKGKIDALYEIGYAADRTGDYTQAVKLFNDVIAQSDSINYTIGLTKGYNGLGLVYELQGDYVNALHYHLLNLEILEKLNDRPGMAMVYNNIAIVYKDQKEYDKSLESHWKSLKISEESLDSLGMAISNFNIGHMYQLKGNGEQALFHYLKTKEITELINDIYGMGKVHHSIGDIYYSDKLYKKAFDYYSKSKAFFEECKANTDITDPLIGLGKIYLQDSNHARAQQYLSQALVMAQKTGHIDNIMNSSELLFQSAKQMGDYQKALDYYVLFNTMKDSTLNSEQIKQLTLLEAEYNFQKERASINYANERARMTLDQQIEKQRNTQNASIVGMVLLVGVLIILYRYYRLKKHANLELQLLNAEIQDRNASLSNLNAEKNSLIGIVAHDLKNPLSNIIGAVGVLKASEKEEEKIKFLDIVQASGMKLIDMISEILNVESIEQRVADLDLSSINLTEIINDVIDQFDQQAKTKNVQLVRDITENVHIIAHVTYVSQVIENLLSNAIKFSSEQKNVFINLSIDQSQALIEVRDEGPGLDEEDKARLFQKYQRLSAEPTAGEDSTGLGLSIVKKFVDAMKGGIWVESEVGRGASFFVAFELA
ncbi:tetratricopeptide repeat protein [Reichenbachiella sp.]|uniref:tetratricopeptide repeat protein n=1 Tax=Reichenbachiella sp. TaxID=2184521 RepID=UPI003BB1EEDD